MSSANGEQLLSTDQVAEILGCSPRMVRKLTHERRIPFVKVGALTRIRPADVMAYVSAHRVEEAL